jgi:hypothetical protein
MKEKGKESNENHGNNGGGVFISGRKRVLEHKMASKHLLRRAKIRGRTGKMICKSGEQEENHETRPRRSWANNQMGNPEKYG